MTSRRSSSRSTSRSNIGRAASRRSSASFRAGARRSTRCSARFASNVEDSFNRAQARAQEISAALASASSAASVAVGRTVRIDARHRGERARAHRSEPAGRHRTDQCAAYRRARPRRRAVPQVGRGSEGDGEPGPARARRDAAGTAPRRARTAAGDERDGRGDASRRLGPDPGVEGARRAGVRIRRRLRRRRAGLDRRCGERDRALRTAGDARRRDRAPGRGACAARDRAGAARRTGPRAGRGPPAPAAGGDSASRGRAFARTGAAGPAFGRSAWRRPRRRRPRRAKDRPQGGWLSNLLAAASRDDADGALAPRGPESLEALTKASPD